jgi:hypothetical protein
MDEARLLYAAEDSRALHCEDVGAWLARVYDDAAKEFAPVIEDPNRRQTIRLVFVHSAPGSETVRSYGGNGWLRIPVPPSLVEDDVRRLVKAFLRDGYRFHGIER